MNTEQKTMLEPVSNDVSGALPLKAPEFGEVLSAAQTRDMVALDAAMRGRIETQVDAFLQEMLGADVHGEDFKRRMDQAFRLGRKEIADASRLNSSFLKQSFRGLEGSAAYSAMSRLRDVMDNLNPGHQGDLLSSQKILGFIPMGNRLKRYLRKFESAGGQIEALVKQLNAAQDDLDRDVVAIEEAKTQLWVAMNNLKSAAYFAEVLQKKLQQQVNALKSSDPERARAFEQEALFYAVQNLDGILAQQAVTINGYLALEPLKKTARELSNGIDRLKTTGTAALSVAQMVAIATANQMRVADALTQTREVIGDLVVQTSVQLGQHCNTTARLATDPAIELSKLQSAFDNTFKAIEAMDNFRSNAIDNMVKNNQSLQQLIDQSKPYLERAAGLIRHDAAATGPVHLA